MKHFSIDTILDILQQEAITCSVQGNSQIVFDAFCALEEPHDHAITWVKSSEYFDSAKVAGIKDLVVLSSEPLEGLGSNACVVVTPKPKAAFAIILQNLFVELDEIPNPGPGSIVLSKNIAQNVVIGANCYIASNVTIGEGTVVQNNVTIYGPTTIGKNCTIASNTVICDQAVVFARDEHGKRRRVPYIAGVEIGDNVDIAMCVDIQSGFLHPTRIENEANIGAHCNVAHNCRIGEGTDLICRVDVCGSTTIGKRVYVAPGAVLLGHIAIGDDALIAASAMVKNNISSGMIAMGVPAKEIRERAGQLSS